MFYMLKRKILMCNFHPACVEQQPIKVEQDIKKNPICLKTVVQSNSYGVLSLDPLTEIFNNPAYWCCLPPKHFYVFFQYRRFWSWCEGYCAWPQTWYVLVKQACTTFYIFLLFWTCLFLVLFWRSADRIPSLDQSV